MRLSDRSDGFARFSLEGPRARAVLEAATGACLDLAPHACAEARLDGVPVLIAAFGWTGEPGFQIIAPVAGATRVGAALHPNREAAGCVEADRATLELLRIEAGIPRFGAELDESVLPDEARLGDATSTTKGCYTGQEVIARLRSRGRVSHLLVGLALDPAEPLPEPGWAVQDGDEPVGESTSSARSADAGVIALAFVRRPRDAAGTSLSVGDAKARVVDLPFVELGARVA